MKFREKKQVDGFSFDMYQADMASHRAAWALVGIVSRVVEFDRFGSSGCRLICYAWNN